MRTMIVDDESWMLVCFRLTCKNVKSIELIGEFSNPLKALEFATNNAIELAFIDIEMSLMNGFQLAQKLRERIPYIRIVFITAYDDAAARAGEAFRNDLYITKPYGENDLRRVMSSIGS